MLFCGLPFVAWQGAWALALAAVLVAEIVLTLWDFVVEVLYGAMIAYLLPQFRAWWTLATGLVAAPSPVPDLLRWTLLAMGIGVVLTGLRDLYAALELPGGAWPWRRSEAGERRA